MKKLLTTAAICGLAVAASPAYAGSGDSAFTLELGGHMKGYVFYSDVDDDSAASVGTDTDVESRDFDIIRKTRIDFTGETTLDNGLTVGFYTEAETDRNAGQDSFDVNETYAYFSGGWGRVNFGSEDGAAYLLQVAVPSADSNLDGLRQFVNPVHYNAMCSAATCGVAGSLNDFDVNGARGGLDYDQDLSSTDDKITYLSPIMNGFQLGLSYTPDTADSADEDAENFDDVENAFGEVYDAALRYEGMFNNVGVTLGAGWSHVDLEQKIGTVVDGSFTDDRTAWNVGVDLDIGPFGVGVTYLEDDYGEIATAAAAGVETATMDDEEVLVVGVDYTTGPFKLGASYMDIDNTGAIDGNIPTGGTIENGVESQRYTGGVVYTYGPGMTFRGSISHVEHDNVASLTTGTQTEATSVMLGTQINF